MPSMPLFSVTCMPHTIMSVLGHAQTHFVTAGVAGTQKQQLCAYQCPLHAGIMLCTEHDGCIRVTSLQICAMSSLHKTTARAAPDNLSSTGPIWSSGAIKWLLWCRNLAQYAPNFTADEGSSEQASHRLSRVRPWHVRPRRWLLGSFGIADFNCASPRRRGSRNRRRASSAARAPSPPQSPRTQCRRRPPAGHPDDHVHWNIRQLFNCSPKFCHAASRAAATPPCAKLWRYCASRSQTLMAKRWSVACICRSCSIGSPTCTAGRMRVSSSSLIIATICSATDRDGQSPSS